VSSDLDRITVARDGYRLARHDRLWAHGLTLTDPVHVETAARLRHQFQHSPPRENDEHPTRDLGDYDRAFGIDFDSPSTGSDDEVA